MLYPTMESLVKMVGNRYLLVNITAHRAREIAEEAMENGQKLEKSRSRLQWNRSTKKASEDRPSRPRPLRKRHQKKRKKQSNEPRLNRRDRRKGGGLAW